jgi:hypothetical protein
MAERISDDALVIRGGRNQPEDLERGTGTHWRYDSRCCPVDGWRCCKDQRQQPEPCNADRPNSGGNEFVADPDGPETYEGWLTIGGLQ